MKNSKLWVVIGILVIAGLAFWSQSNEGKDQATIAPTELTPADSTLVGTQEPIPESQYDPKTPLSRNKIILKNNMKIEITKEGAGDKIENGQIAVMTYVGKLENGTIFDASKNHGDGSFSFTLGVGQVIKGWDEGVLGMRVGESRILTIPSDLAYGQNGIPGVIPPSATLVFDVSLIGIK